MPHLSIITPCFNASKLINELAQSLRQQTLKDFEWCIVDDGSEQETRQILAEISKYKDLDVKLSLQKKQGGNFCRNHGFEISKAPYVKFVDADDLLESDLLQQQFDVIKNQPAPTVVVSPTKIMIEDSVGPASKLDAGLKSDPLRSYLSHPCFMHGGCLLSREVVTSAGGWDEELTAGQDLDFFRRVFLTEPVVQFATSAFIYRQHQAAPRISKLGKGQLKKFQSHLAGLDKFQQLLNESGRLDSYAIELARNYDIWGMKAVALDIPFADQFFDAAKKLSPLQYRSGSRYSQKLRRVIGNRMTGKLMRSNAWHMLHRKLSSLGLWGSEKF
ncbi:glycosyltransferase family 2 protein [Mariniblastus sp.]|nr:glycosyltransferase family 2 protein [Mariniblastus sp.]